MRILDEGLVHLEEGEIVPASCLNCSYIWQPQIDESVSALKCPLCGTECKLEDLPTWSAPPQT